MDAHKELSRKSLSMWSARVPFAPQSVFAADYRNHQEPLADGGVRTVDLATWEAIVKQNHVAFPDLTVEILDQIGEGDRVVTRWRFSATHRGPYEGRGETGTPVTWSGIQIDRITGDRIVESWVVWDKYTLFEALGLIR